MATSCSFLFRLDFVPFFCLISTKNLKRFIAEVHKEFMRQRGRPWPKHKLENKNLKTLRSSYVYAYVTAVVTSAY